MASSSSSSSTWMTEKASGSHLFKIADYSLAKEIGVGNSIRSAPFTVGGYYWIVECFPCGDEKDSADCIGLFLTLESDVDKNNVQVFYTMNLVNLLDQTGPPSEPLTNADVFSKDNCSWGWDRFMRRADLEKSRYLKDDCFTIYCAVTVPKAPRLQVGNAGAVAAPPSDLPQHLARLLESGEGTDVTFEVGGETFAAHRCVLAARSPVFRAELFGSMKERRARCIKLDDMEAAVFKALLHFIYSDKLPSYMEKLHKESSTMMAQHLLVAADRYGLDRLKLICEDKLCREMEIDTVANTLNLAEQHQCRRLKAICLNFVAAPRVLAAVIETGGFEHLGISCPSVMKELLKKITNMTALLVPGRKVLVRV
ncbi:BTB/POZ and MATH domain-containing protein 1 [Ananas comosus]|uniref:BTB/POZ and MATH domain-containing protein 1 n=1 Tax=Ananas comosus TaxID=4615 RepID=A0A199VJA0_ANACO|nr:BTB/POZ and MATH domain-containing protein 1 [Ananas comosus]